MAPEDTIVAAPGHLTSPIRGVRLGASTHPGDPMESLKDKTAVVTGGASGIGRALCLAFAGEGARIVVADIDEAGMAETAHSVAKAGSKAITVKTDVARLASVQSLADRAFGEFGRVHLLCNNAGVAVHGSLDSASH
ncbi:MAG TPA: SDR family NAD(P)-dependent oxidoreductase, partial [Methylomirabilota bacterium]|nr:SDR family NAD(P)-dependent oxidoreductase [Methylomirabilota bacterium]